ncbi:MAG: fatty acid desaturase [Mariniblastus sp.]
MSAIAKDWIHDARQSINDGPVDFYAIKPVEYWKDLIVCVVVAYTAATLYLSLPFTSVLKYVSFPIAVFWLYRASSMVHEVSHLSKKQLGSFKIGWNILLGIPTLFPSTFFSSHHRDHHTGRHYGTSQDPEYILNVFTPGTIGGLIFFVAYLSVYPVFVLLRFMLAPISYLHPTWREFTLRRLSSFTLNWKYERNVNRIDRKVFNIVELTCCLRAWMIPFFMLIGMTEWTRFPQMYLLAISVLFCNQMRFLADHHFESHGEPMSMSDHIVDSCNYSKNGFLTWLFFPFTIRYHALHHLFPTIPYHNLPAAHQHLTDNLAADSLYHTLDRPGWWYTVRENLGLSKKETPAIQTPMQLSDFGTNDLVARVDEAESVLPDGHLPTKQTVL